MNLRELLTYFAKLGATCFGGPFALCHAIHRDLVEDKKWFTESEYLDGMALANLAPGPLATQVAIYLGWLRFRLIGALLTAVCFVLPSFIMVAIIAALYVRYGELGWIQGLSFGMSGAIIAVILRTANDLTRKLLGKDLLLWLIAMISAVVTLLSNGENFWLFIAAGLLVWAARQGKPGAAQPLSFLPSILVTGMQGVVPLKLLPSIFIYFFKVGAFVFGSGMVIVPFLHGGVVEHFRWLNERQFLDACAVAMLTPGPIVIAVAFIGYLVAGLTGSVLATLGIFLPCFLFVVLAAPIYQKLLEKRALKDFVIGVTSAAIGAIFAAAVNLAKGSIKFDASMLILVASLALLFSYRKLPAALIVAGAAVAGLIVGAF